MIIDKSSKIPHINIDENVTFPKFSFLLSNGERKNKKKSPLKANRLLAPAKNILSAPSPKIGIARSNLSKSKTNIEVKKMLINAIGTMIVFDFIIDFFPIILAITATNKKININKK